MNALSYQHKERTKSETERRTGQNFLGLLSNHRQNKTVRQDIENLTHLNYTYELVCQ
jgi:hypothetical protein